MDVERLRRLDLFAELDYHDLSQVARWVHEVDAEAGDVLMEQGAMPFEMLVIESGTVEVIRDGEVLATLGAGDPVGEMSLLRHERRMATVRAATRVSAVALRVGDLEEMQSEMPEVLADIRAVMDERQRRNLEARGQTERWAVRPSHPYRMLIAREITSTASVSETADWAIIVIFAQVFSGSVSVGLKAVAVVNETKR